MILLDTHLFVHLVLGSPLRFAMEYETAPLAVSPISAAEIACLERLGRLRLHDPADTWFDRAVRAVGARVLPLTPGLLARAMRLDWEHKDPADRILVQHTLDDADLELHTRDAKILARALSGGFRVRDCRL